METHSHFDFSYEILLDVVELSRRPERACHHETGELQTRTELGLWTLRHSPDLAMYAYFVTLESQSCEFSTISSTPLLSI